MNVIRRWCDSSREDTRFTTKFAHNINNIVMITSPVVSSTASAVDLRPSRLLSWGAIFGGCFAALSIHILLTMLGIGLGVRMIDPLTNDNPASDFTATAGIVWTVSALISMAIGGWVAGRSINVGESRSGFLHGFVVWSLATVVVFTFLSGGAGLAVSGAAKAVGKGVAGAASAVGSAGKEAAESTPITDWAGAVVQGATDELRLPGQQGPLPAANKREIGLALTRFAAQPNDERRNALITSLTNAGAPRDFAESTVRRWEDSMGRIRTQVQEMKDEAAAQARQAADKAAKGLSQGAIWTFVGFLLGAVAAGFGGRMGAAAAQQAPAREAASDFPKREDVARRSETATR